MNITQTSTLACVLCILGWSTRAHAYASAEVLTTDAYQYGRFEASIRFVSGPGVIGSFFLWKDGSEVEGAFWNELDFETLDADCELATNAFYGNPEQVHSERAEVATVCGAFHTYTYEWTPDYVAWLVDGEEVRRETGEAAAAFRDNTTEGMQIRFNLWPGDASFGGTFDPSVLPVYQHIDWVQYLSYDGSGFNLEWREEFDAALPAGWVLGDWTSPKNISTHSPLNVGVSEGALVLALTADDAQGIPGVTGAGGVGGTTGAGGTDPASSVVTTGAGGSGGSSATGTTADTTAGGITSTGTNSVGTSNVGGAATTTGGSQSGTTAGSVSSTTGGTAGPSSSVTSTATGSDAASTAATTTGGPGAMDATALGGTNGSSAVNPSNDGAGCACRSAGYRQTPGSLTPLGGLALLTLGASLQIIRRNKRQLGPTRCSR